MRKLLIVDDNSINRRILKAMLMRDYALLEAESGEAALAMLAREADAISAVLLDIVMPGMDGYEVLRRIREDPVLPPIPVIMITGNEDESAHVKALALGANDFLMKPYNADILRHCLINNITMRENATLVRAAQFDELTGLYNRRGFFTRAAELIAQHEPGYYVMACFDVDNFKVVNDQYGTEKGDEALRYIADVFRRGFEPEGGICCRISADNFAVLYPGRFMDSPGLADIRRAAATPVGPVMPVSFSIGRYIVDDLSLPVSAMYDRAALAEESAKGRYGDNIAVYDETMRERLLHEQRLVTEMKTALETGQFEVWLQPQYNLVSGALVGTEALVRWRRPADGLLVLPGDFIPVFERNGFIYEVDKFVWQQVCSLLRKWIDAGRNPLPVAVNISRNDVFHEDFFDTITGLLEQYRLPVELLRLEITETAFAKATDQIVSIAKALIAYGFTVEIDDFGSGYSSLNTLKDVPADILKLDMKFLENTGDSQRGGNILESIVRMAKWLGMSVIAEGVEAKEQADYLKSIGCNYVQGYLYGRPMPTADFERLAEGHDKEREMIVLQTVETLDNSAFWDPRSMDTLIFNSYVGGACIFEYCGGKAEILRVNNKYRELFGQTASSGDTDAMYSMDYMDESNQSIFLSNIRRAIDSNQECTCETVSTGLPGIDGPLYIRSTVRVIARAGERYLLYSSVIDMTEQRRSEQKVLETSRELEQMMQDMPGGYVKMRITDSGVTPIFLNDEFCRLCGMNHKQAMALYEKDAYAGVHPDDVAYVSSVISEAIAERATLSIRIRFANNRGGYVPMQVFYRVTEDAGGLFLNGYYTDATEINSFEEQRRELLENLPCGAGVYEITSAGIRATYLNKQYRAYLKREINDLSVAPVFEVVHPDDINKLKGALQQALSVSKEGACDIRIMDGAGGYIPFHVVGRIIERSRDKTCIYVTYTPVTERELLLHMRAETDGMTGVYNKATAEAMIRERLSEERGAPCAMLIVDVDDLKTLNDSMGHPQGDRAICLIADALKAQFRKTDIIGRIGGDEFIVFVQGVKSRKRLNSMASNLIKSLTGVMIGEAEDYPVRMSIGMANAHTGAATFEELYAMADAALYEAKRNGKNQYAIYSGDADR